MIHFSINREKALETLAFVAKESPNISFYNLAKVLYFADKQHLNEFGRPIIGDRYVAMEHGPVPSFVYHVLKRDSFLDLETLEDVENTLKFSDIGLPTIRLQKGRDVRENVFSESDIRCLKKAIDEYAHLSPEELRDIINTDAAYRSAQLNCEIDYEEMIYSDKANREELLDEFRYISQWVVV